VILRLIRGPGDATAVDALCADLKAKLGPDSGELAGPARVHLATRPGGSGSDVLLTAFWGSAEAAASGDRREISPFSLARRHLTDVAVEVFEVDETILRRSDDEPELIRVATGTFSKPGADIEMLDLLRQRAPLIGDVMSEAFVGRRMVERAVEVTFVSAWRSAPEDRSLDEPFWPDIALRYDAFEVAVYRTVPFDR
jgi:hypothetical protein